MHGSTGGESTSRARPGSFAAAGRKRAPEHGEGVRLGRADGVGTGEEVGIVVVGEFRAAAPDVVSMRPRRI